MEKTIPYSKRFVALGTALTDKYKSNPYVRSTVNVMGVQILLSLTVIALVFFSMRIQNDSLAELRNKFIETNPTITLSEYVAVTADARSAVMSNTLIAVTLCIVLLALLFGYLTAQYALRPSRDSLKYQKRFIGSIAHELRTPLAIMKTSTEVALMEKGITPNARATFETTISELNRISETINNLVSFDSLIRPALIRTRPIHLPTVLEDVVERHAELAITRGITLTTHIESEAYVMGNLVALEQVFTNIIKNALNYTPSHDDQSVSVKLSISDDAYALISVIDTGVGIAQNDLYHVFEPFYRGDTSRARGVGGGTSGLGLAIVHEIVRMHNGKITIRSALNRGTTIEICFPQADTTEYVQEFSIPEDNAEHEFSVTGANTSNKST